MMDVNEKDLTLNVYDTDSNGKPIDYSVTSVRQPKDDCISLKISLKESLQIEKLRVKIKNLKPYIEHAEELKNVKEGEFGYKLID